MNSTPADFSCRVGAVHGAPAALLRCAAASPGQTAAADWWSVIGGGCTRRWRSAFRVCRQTPAGLTRLYLATPSCGGAFPSP